MFTRDTAIHLSAILVGFAILVAVSMFAPSLDDPLYVIALLAFYGMLFGGAHAYLAWRGESGMVPVDSRWRFVTALAAILGLGAVGALGPNGEVAGFSIDTLLFVAGGCVALVYFVAEARSGYRERRPA